MLEIPIPGYRTLRLAHLVLDYNGTLACDGRLLDGVKERLAVLSATLAIHVLTADTFGQARAELAGVPCDVSILPGDEQAPGKLAYLQGLGPEATVCIGNGRNDRLMLKEAALGIAVMLDEGAAVETVRMADVVCTTIHSALDLLRHPLRLVATLRS
jgi:soluble P-type ATPase